MNPFTHQHLIDPMNFVDKELLLEQRESLPDALRVLVEQFPREIWESHTNFGEMVQFWLQRHVMFRRLLSMIQKDIEDHEAEKLRPDQYRHRFARLGNTFVGELHMHHNIEDQYYFPRLQALESTLGRGFQLLDADHHAIDGHLEMFSKNANAALSAPDDQLKEEVLRLHDNVENLEKFLNRHLTDEEELVVPIVLKHGFEE